MHRSLFSLLFALLLGAPAAPLRAGADDDLYATAARAYGEQQWEQAARQFERLLAAEPSHAKADQARFFCGESLAQLDRWADARRQFQALLEHAPDHRYARQSLFRSGEAALLSGDAPAAERDLKSFVEKYPDDPLNNYALPYLASIELEARKFPQALQSFTLALQRFQDGPLADECRLGMGRCEKQLDHLDQARQWFRQVAQGNRPLAGQALLDLATLESQAGDFAASAAAFEELSRRFPKVASRASAQLSHGYAMYKLKRYAEAEPLLGSLENDRDVGVDARYWLGLSQKARSQWATAAKTLSAGAAIQRDHRLAPALSYHAGEALLHDQQLPAAREQFRLSLSAAPQGPWADDATLGLVRIAIEEGRHEECLSWCQSFTQQFADSPLLQSVELTAGQALAALGRHEEAADKLNRLFADKALNGRLTDSQRGEAERLLAATYTQLGRIDDAARTLESSSADPGRVQSRLQLAEAAYKAEKWDAACDQFARIVAEKPQDDSLPRALSGLGWSHYRAGRWIESAASFGQLLESYPEHLLAAEAALARGRALEEADQLPAAAEMYDLAAKRFAMSDRAADALWLAGRLHERLKQPDRAIACYRQLIEQHRSFSELDTVLYRCAVLLRHAKQDSAADELLARLRRDFPNSQSAPSAAYQMAEAAYRRGEYELAIERFAALTASADTQPWGPVACLRHAQALAQLKRWPEAIDVARALLIRHTNFDQAHEAQYLIGRAYAAQADFTAAREWYAKAIVSPTASGTQTAALAQWMIGESYFHQENYQAALLEYQKLDERHPHPRLQAAGLLQAGKCRENLRQWSAAADDYQRLLKDFPDSDLCQEATQRLNAARARLAVGSKNQK